MPAQYELSAAPLPLLQAPGTSLQTAAAAAAAAAGLLPCQLAAILQMRSAQQLGGVQSHAAACSAGCSA
jgi:hypothetical protein